MKSLMLSLLITFISVSALADKPRVFFAQVVRLEEAGGEPFYRMIEKILNDEVLYTDPLNVGREERNSKGLLGASNMFIAAALEQRYNLEISEHMKSNTTQINQQQYREFLGSLWAAAYNKGLKKVNYSGKNGKQIVKVRSDSRFSFQVFEKDGYKYTRDCTGSVIPNERELLWTKPVQLAEIRSERRKEIRECESALPTYRGLVVTHDSAEALVDKLMGKQAQTLNSFEGTPSSLSQ